MDWKDRKVLVTGATGFMGAQLVKRLVGLKADVSAWAASTRHLYRMGALESHIRFALVDIRHADEIKNAVRTFSPEIIFHLAAYGVNYDEQDVNMALDINVHGTANVLNAVSETSCRKVVGTGTWAEYGMKDYPCAETESLEPVGIYGTTKAASTLVACGIARHLKIPLIMLRPFSVYGPGEGEYKFIPSMICSYLKEEQPKLTSCRQIRDYIFVEDVIDAYLTAAEISVREPTVINIASGRPVALRDMALAVSNCFSGVPPLFGAIPDRTQEIWRSEADITRAENLLQWQPRYSLEEGIRMTVDWFRMEKKQACV